MPGTIPPGTAVLWHGNDYFLKQEEPDPRRPPFMKQEPPKPKEGDFVVVPHFIAATDMGGNILVKVQDPPNPPDPDYGTRAIGIAFDGTNLWFSNQDAGGGSNSVIQKRTADGLTKLDTIFPAMAGAGIHTVDIAFDTKRGQLWQMDYGQLAIQDPPIVGGPVVPAPNPIAPTLTRIDLANHNLGAPTLGTITLPVPPGFELGGGYGVTYDSDSDLLYFSLSNMTSKQEITAGVVMVMRPDPTTKQFTGKADSFAKVFESSDFPIFGLGFQTGTGTLNGQGTLWTGGFGVVRHLTLAGDLLATVTSPDAQFLDGLEFVSG